MEKHRKNYIPKLSVIYVNKFRKPVIAKIVTSTTDKVSSPTPALTIVEITTKPPNQQQLSICYQCNTSEVCLQNDGHLYPKCYKIVDSGDPTGCGGLCKSGEQFCRLLDTKLKIRACLDIPGVKFDCGPNHFKCVGSQMCIPMKKKCDGVIDCFDRSDEKQCDCNLKTSFRCGENLSCLSKKHLCDGSVNCWDASDELFCANGTTCKEHEFLCRTGGCIPRERFCDGHSDCKDKSDEPLGCLKNDTIPN